jgi:hypothetical protein
MPPDDGIGVVWDVQWQFLHHEIALIGAVGKAGWQGHDQVCATHRGDIAGETGRGQCD